MGAKPGSGIEEATAKVIQRKIDYPNDLIICLDAQKAFDETQNTYLVDAISRQLSFVKDPGGFHRPLSDPSRPNR
jgi:hypothetical protein